jgi:hypothetical protein
MDNAIIYIGPLPKESEESEEYECVLDIVQHPPLDEENPLESHNPSDAILQACMNGFDTMDL